MALPLHRWSSAASSVRSRPVNDSDKQWTYGWTIGTGIEYAVTDNFSVGLEYLYIRLDDTEPHAHRRSPVKVGNLDMDYNDMHTVRLGLAYRFGL